MSTPIELSFKSRIRNIAKEKRIDPAQLWQNLVLERFLVRLNLSKYAAHFILKGGVLLSHYVDLDRHTHDLDFLIHKLSHQIKTLHKVISEIIQISVNDGFKFTDLKIKPLPHPHMKYSGARATLWALFGKTRFQLSIDLGFGDIIEPTRITFPLIKGNKGALLESEIEVIGYPKEFIFAEKLETIVYRGTNNSRMKDFHDLEVLIKSKVLNPKKAEQVIESVFNHRDTQKKFPIFLSSRELGELQGFWSGHLRTLPKQHKMPKNLDQIIKSINMWLMKNTQLCKS